jgi:perosamine synthetase
MTHGSSIVPVYPTISFSHLLAPRSSRWQSAFPFSDPTGVWAFSGRVALQLGLPVLNLPPQSTILFPNYFEGVELETLLTNGFKLRFYRLNDRFTVDLDDAEQKLDSAVSALYMIHYFGFPQPLEPIKRFCEKHSLKLIEDCALSLFSRDENGWLGTTGDLALYSVYKTLALPHGGFLVTKNGRATRSLQPPPFKSTLLQTKDLVHQYMKASGWQGAENWILRLTAAGKRLLGWKQRDSVSSGVSAWDPRIMDLDASPWVLRLMRHVDPEAVINCRRRNYAHLASLLRGKIVTPPPFDELPDGVCPLFFPVMVEDKILFQKQLTAMGVQTINLWYHSHPACPPELTEEASKWRNHLLELPIHHDLSLSDVDRVADAVLELLQHPHE